MRNKTNYIIINLNIHEHLILEKKLKQKRGAEKTKNTTIVTIHIMEEWKFKNIEIKIEILKFTEK